MTEPVLRVQGLSKRYGKQLAVDGVSLQVRAGEFVALLGPNGAGKSTLLQMLTGLFAADAGSALIGGHDIRDGTAALAQLGVVFQQATLDLEMSALRNLRFHARLHGLPRRFREQEIDSALHSMALTARAQEPVRKLSGGNRRRVEVARALLHQPRLLLMDEASAGLDPASRRDLLASVQTQCRERSLAVLWATHRVEEVSTADRILVLDQGRIIADAAPDQLLLETASETLETAFLSLTEKFATPARVRAEDSAVRTLS